MAEPLLQTKLHIPVTRGQLVARPRLRAYLAQGLTGRLTLLSAPAGFGKTTLVAAWARELSTQQGQALAWLSLDEGDNDLGRFCRYLSAALARVDAALGLDVPPTLAPASSQPLLTALLNQLAEFEGDLTLALDDYHLIDNSAIHDCLLFLLAHAPANFHLLLLSRADPPFSLARLRAGGQVTEIRQQDLRFAPAESEEFLNQLMQLGLPATAVSSLSARTEGWVAGLQMAAISLQGHDDPAGFIAGFSSSHRYIFDYLAEEVLARRPAGSREFLLYTAILERLSAPLCAALLGHAESDEAAQTLAQLEAANLFLMPLDEERRWYRYHQLFANLLRQQLRREQPERLAGLHQVASDWFAREGYRDEAIEHALAGDLFAQATALVAEASNELVIQGEISKLLGWIGRLPAKMVTQHPQLSLNHAWAVLFRGSPAEVETVLQGMPAGLAETMPYSAYQMVIRSTLASRQGDPATAVQLAEGALAALTARAADPLGLVMQGAAALTLAYGHQRQGEADKAVATFARAMALNEAAGNMLAALNAARGWGELLLAQGDLAGAEARCRAGLALVADQPRSLLAAPLQVSLGQLCLETGRLAEAEALLVDANKLLALSGPVNQGEGLVALARLRLAQAQPAAVEPLLRELQTLQRQAPSGYARQQLTQALAGTTAALLAQQPDPGWRALLANLLATGVAGPLSAARGWLALAQPARALNLLEPATAASAQQEAAGHWLVAALLRALAHAALGDEAAALRWLERSLQVGGPAGFRQIYLELGPPLHPQLTILSRQNDAVGQLAGQILAQLPAPPAESPAAATPIHPAAAQLSPREIEVLQLIAQGLSNKAIAARLVIAPSTAKRHTSNIYLKLDVTNRAEAAARAYELGLV